MSPRKQRRALMGLRFCHFAAPRLMTAKTWSMPRTIPNSFSLAARVLPVRFPAPASTSVRSTARRSAFVFRAIGAMLPRVSIGWWRNCTRTEGRKLFQIGAENGHLEIVGALVVLVVDE